MDHTYIFSIEEIVESRHAPRFAKSFEHDLGEDRVHFLDRVAQIRNAGSAADSPWTVAAATLLHVEGHPP